MDVLVVAGVAAVVLVPLIREYADFRAAGLARLAALATTMLLVPALGVGLAVGLPLAADPLAQWAATVAVTVVVYSLATRAILARASSAATAPSRRT